jgi:hypothetical protein
MKNSHERGGSETKFFHNFMSGIPVFMHVLKLEMIWDFWRKVHRDPRYKS